MYHPDQFVKLTNFNGINNGFQYQEGLNEDIHELNQDEECAPGGLYFCRFKDVGEWIRRYGYDVLIWKVEIPKNEKVIEYFTKLKAKRIILSDPKKVCDDYNICKLVVQKNGLNLEFVKEQTPELCELAVRQTGYALRYVKEQTDEICKLAVLKDPASLHYVRNQTIEICEFALRKDGFALQSVIEQTPELCKLAVMQNCHALQFVKEQTPELCKIAVKKYWFVLKYVINQTEELCKLAVKQCPNAISVVNQEFRYLLQK